MSLTTEEAIKGAMSNIKDALLCLIDATEVDCFSEREELDQVYRSIKNKLENVPYSKEMKNEFQTKDRQTNNN